MGGARLAAAATSAPTFSGVRSWPRWRAVACPFLPLQGVLVGRGFWWHRRAGQAEGLSPVESSMPWWHPAASSSARLTPLPAKRLVSGQGPQG